MSLLVCTLGVLFTFITQPYKLLFRSFEIWGKWSLKLVLVPKLCRFISIKMLDHWNQTVIAGKLTPGKQGRA